MAHGKSAERVIEANQRFYNALQAQDFDAMQAVWEHSERTTCVHPGGVILRGWDVISTDWKRVLVTYATPSDIILTNAAVAITAEVAWVTIDADVIIGGASRTFAESNIFARHDDQWLMVAHHASTILPRTETCL